MKPASPLLARTRVGLKPHRLCGRKEAVFRAFFGCSGVGGFMLVCISGCSGVIGFKVGTWPCPVREKVRPARLDVCVSAKKFAQQAQNDRKTLFSGALGELFRGSVGGGAVLGELFREYTAGWVTLGELFRAGCGKGRHSDGFFVEKSRILSRNDDVHNAGRSQAPRPGPGQPHLQRPKRSARPRVMRGRAATLRMLGRQAIQTTLRPQAAQASYAHFFSSVTRYTLVSRSWKPARW